MMFSESVPASWRSRKNRYLLVGTICNTCKTKHFPERAVCPVCGSDGLSQKKMASTGKILTYTVLYTGPAGFEMCVPYTVGIIELDNGPRISAHIIGDKNKVKIGTSVEAVFRKINQGSDSGIINYGLKFQIIE